MSSLEEIIVEESEVHIRLDKLLVSRFPNFSRTYFQALIDQGLVLVNSERIKKGQRLRAGDEIEICFTLPPEISALPQDIPLSILYEDEHIIAVNKPASMVVHPAPGHHDNTLVNALLYHCKSLSLSSPSDLRPGIVHRLDKDTTGVILAAKTREAHSKLVTLFAERKIEKTYLAITTKPPKEGLLSAPIRRDPFHRQKMRVDPLGKEAISEIHIEEKTASLVLCKVRLITGRTHQIRVHLQHLGCPILGDPVYGSPGINTRFSIYSQMLHAYHVRLKHPISSQTLELTAPLQEPMKTLLLTQGARIHFKD